MHGFSLNINPDLNFYKYIIPCGIKEYGVTSMAKIMGSEVPSMDEIKTKMTKRFTKNFVSYKS